MEDENFLVKERKEIRDMEFETWDEMMSEWVRVGLAKEKLVKGIDHLIDIHAGNIKSGSLRGFKGLKRRGRVVRNG